MKAYLKVVFLLPVVIVMGIVAYLMTSEAKKPQLHVITGSPFVSTAITNLTANLFTSEGHLGPAENDVYIEFRNSTGKLVDVGNVTLQLRLAGAAAIVNNLFKGLPTATPGQYRMTIQPQIVGDWQAKLSISSPAYHADASFPVTVK